MRGKIKDLVITRSGEQLLTISTKQDITSLCDELKDKEIDFELKKHNAKRSLDANAYCWVLCGKLAEALAKENPRITKEAVYRRTIQQVGIYQDVEINAEAIKTLSVAWGKQGTGWFIETVDKAKNDKKSVVRLYYGSSCYNTAQMSRIIDYLVEDCRDLGIPTETPEEIAKMKSLWKSEPIK